MPLTSLARASPEEAESFVRETDLSGYLSLTRPSEVPAHMPPESSKRHLKRMVESRCCESSDASATEKESLTGSNTFRPISVATRSVPSLVTSRSFTHDAPRLSSSPGRWRYTLNTEPS